MNVVWIRISYDCWGLRSCMFNAALISNSSNNASICNYLVGFLSIWRECIRYTWLTENKKNHYVWDYRLTSCHFFNWITDSYCFTYTCLHCILIKGAQANRHNHIHASLCDSLRGSIRFVGLEWHGLLYTIISLSMIFLLIICHFSK